MSEKRIRYYLSIRVLPWNRYMRSLGDLMKVFFPHKSTEAKRKAAIKIFESIRDNKKIPFIAHLVDANTPESTLKKALREMQELGLVEHTGTDWQFSDDLSKALRDMADAIRSFMQPKTAYKKHQDLKYKLKLSRKALEQSGNST